MTPFDPGEPANRSVRRAAGHGDIRSYGELVDRSDVRDKKLDSVSVAQHADQAVQKYIQRPGETLSELAI
jgi:hypothetical protein